MEKSIEEFRINTLELIKNRYSLNMNGLVQTDIPNLDFYISSEPTEFNAIIYEPSLCIIVQGSKAVGFGEELYSYNTKKYLLSSTHVPAKVRITEASDNQPYVSFRVKFALEDIYDVIKNVDIQKFSLNMKSEKGLFFDDLNEKLYDPVYRLIRLLDSSESEINYLSPMIIKEILFILVNDKSGYFLRAPLKTPA